MWLNIILVAVCLLGGISILWILLGRGRKKKKMIGDELTRRDWDDEDKD